MAGEAAYLSYLPAEPLVVPSENETSSSGGQHGARSDARQQGSSRSSTTQGPGVEVATDHVTRHQARLQAATAAASIYEKSYVYPSANTLVWSPGNAVPPRASAPIGDSMKVKSSGERISIGQQQFAIPGGQANLTFPQFPHYVFVPIQLPCQWKLRRRVGGLIRIFQIPSWRLRRSSSSRLRCCSISSKNFRCLSQKPRKDQTFVSRRQQIVKERLLHHLLLKIDEDR